MIGVFKLQGFICIYCQGHAGLDGSCRVDSLASNHSNTPCFSGTLEMGRIGATEDNNGQFDEKESEEWAPSRLLV